MAVPPVIFTILYFRSIDDQAENPESAVVGFDCLSLCVLFFSSIWAGWKTGTDSSVFACSTSYFDFTKWFWRPSCPHQLSPAELFALQFVRSGKCSNRFKWKWTYSGADSVHFFLKALKLVSKSEFPESASNNEWARYLYYLGRIKAVQLNYSAAHKDLLQALRKAPQHTAVGFKQIVHKLAITVELLLGDIPERSTFYQPSLKRALDPYLKLTQGTWYFTYFWKWKKVSTYSKCNDCSCPFG